MRVLIAHGSKMGGTAGLAEMLADALRADGFEVDVLPAREVRTVDSYDAVVVGGGLYAMRWHRDARRFVRRHRNALARLPLWLFSSGPLDGSATEKDIPPVRQVRAVMDRTNARGHETFGGRIAPDAEGFIASKMAKNLAGDWRDPEHVARWAHEIAASLRNRHPEPAS